MKQREIWFANLNPTKGREQKGIRPVVILSGNALNENMDICIVCPVSSKIKQYAGCLILKKDKINGLKYDSEIITFQVRTIAKERLIKKIGEITNEQLRNLKQGLIEILHY
jgi:mRNA interferase MazF